MSGSLDIYGLTIHRDQATINRFLDTYVDRDASENRGDEELKLLSLKKASLPNEEYDWEPAYTLTHSIQRGLDFPRRCFTLYLTSKAEEIVQAILSFTDDNQLILGLSLEDNYEGNERAGEVMTRLVAEYDCHLGMEAVVQPPPESEDDFRRDEGKFLVLRRYERQKS